MQNNTVQLLVGIALAIAIAILAYMGGVKTAWDSFKEYPLSRYEETCLDRAINDTTIVIVEQDQEIVDFLNKRIKQDSMYHAEMKSLLWAIYENYYLH